MLNNLSEQIRGCLQHAEESARKAAAQPDGSPLKQDYLNLEESWLRLARRFELGEQLTDFTNTKPIAPFLAQSFDPETAQAITNALVTTCKSLGLSDRDDAMTQLVAEKIIELAQRGLKNPTALHFAAIKEFKSDPQ